MSLIVFVILYLISSTAGLMFLKESVSGFEVFSFQTCLELLSDYKFIFGFFLYAFSFIMWLVLLSKKDLSFIYPIVIGLSYISIMAMAILIFKEDFTLNKATGASLIGVGIIVIFLHK